MSNFLAKLVQKWMQSRNIMKKFETKNMNWLNEALLLIDTPSTPGRPEMNVPRKQN